MGRLPGAHTSIRTAPVALWGLQGFDFFLACSSSGVGVCRGGVVLCAVVRAGLRSDKQHVLDLYCSKGKNCCYEFYSPSFGMAYGNPRFSDLGKVLTRVALDRSRMVLCSPDWGAHEGNEYWRTLLDKLTLASIKLPDDAIYVPLGRKLPIGKPGWGSMLSVVDGSLAPVPRENLDSAMVQEIQREISGFTLDVLRKHLRPRDTVDTTSRGEEYVVSDTVAPNSPCRVSNPDVVSECWLSELPSSIHPDDETEA